MPVYLCGYMHMSAVAYGGQKRALDSLVLERHVIVSHLMWALGTEFRSRLPYNH